jgi:bis(5'-nucleosyl)-tetraphosphatase (symmetrical)
MAPSVRDGALVWNTGLFGAPRRMATYVVGDVQGCYEELRELARQIGFDPRVDRLWLAGDLVNRGPQSLEVLEWVWSLGSAAVPILGNHEIHFLGVALGVLREREGDTLGPLLASRRGHWLRWVQSWPLLVVDEEHRVCVVHAGLPPHWDLPTARRRASEAQDWLRSDGVSQVVVRAPMGASDAPLPLQRARETLAYFTRMRVCDAAGRLDLGFKGEAADAPAGYLPWFAHEHRAWDGTRVIFGHWSALNGHTGRVDALALDTGCVWGRQLTALRLEDGRRYSCDCAIAGESTAVE